MHLNTRDSNLAYGICLLTEIISKLGSALLGPGEEAATQVKEGQLDWQDLC